MPLQHEQVVVERGARSGRTLIVAVHSTAAVAVAEDRVHRAQSERAVLVGA